jgi:hypothetical protein
MFTNEEIITNSFYFSRCHDSCDITVHFPEELYIKYKSGEIDRETFEKSVGFSGDLASPSYVIFKCIREIVEDFLEEQEQEEANKLAKIKG